MSDSIRRQRQAREKQQKAGVEKLRRARLDQKVEKLTGVRGMTLRKLAADIMRETGNVNRGWAYHRAHTLLGELETLDRLKEREREQQWRMLLVDF